VELGGQEQTGVVLLSDLRDFTTLMEKRNPEDMIKQLNEYFTEMVKIIAKHDGIVSQFVGDAIKAVFGILGGDKSPQDSAIESAVEMQERLKVLNREWKKRGLPEFDMGVGVSYGDFISGNIGSEERKEFVCIGEAVANAEILESYNKQAKTKILISENMILGLKYSDNGFLKTVKEIIVEDTGNKLYSIEY